MSLIGVGLPQIELRQVRRAQLRDIGDGRAGIERQTEDVGLEDRPRAPARSPWLAVMVAMRDEPRSGQMTPEPTSRKCGATMRRVSCSSVSLVSANTIHDGCAPASQRADLDAPHDAVRARRGRDLHAVPLRAVMLDGVGEVDRVGIGRHADDWTANAGRREGRGRDKAAGRAAPAASRARAGGGASPPVAAAKTQTRLAAAKLGRGSSSTSANRMWSRQAPSILR